MAHFNLEVFKDSRKIKNARTGMEEVFVFRLCLDDTIPAVADHASIFGAEDDVVALEYAYTLIPLTRYLPDYTGPERLLVLDSVQILQKNSQNSWDFEAKYVFNVNTGTGGQSSQGPTLPYIKIGFTIGGGTKRITSSLSEVSKAVLKNGVNMPLPEDSRVLGYSENGDIEGTDVPSSLFRFQITAYYLPWAVTLPYGVRLMRLIGGARGTGSYNARNYLGAAIGEVQYLSVSGGGVVVDIIPLTHEFSLSPNLTDQPDEGYPDITMLGHDRVQYDYFEELEEITKRPVLQPNVRRIHRVHTPENYGQILIPGAF